MAKTSVNLDLGCILPDFDLNHLWDEHTNTFDMYANLWTEVGTLFSSYQLVFPETEYNNRQCFEISINTDDFVDQFHGDHKPLLLNINISGIENEKDRRLATRALTCFIQDLFLAMTICIPGSFPLSERRIMMGEEELDIPKYYSALLGLAWSRSKEWGWPKFHLLTLECAWKWIEGIGLRNTQVARTPAQRALITLLNICNNDNMYGWLLTILDVTHALEGLLVDQSTGISRLLRDRLALILGSPKSDTKWLNGFYDLRSRYVHGDFPVIRIDADEGLDSEVDPYWWRIMRTIEKGLVAFLALLQYMAKNSIKEFKFTETVEYIKV